MKIQQLNLYRYMYVVQEFLYECWPTWAIYYLFSNWQIIFLYTCNKMYINLISKSRQKENIKTCWIWSYTFNHGRLILSCFVSWHCSGSKFLFLYSLGPKTGTMISTKITHKSQCHIQNLLYAVWYSKLYVVTMW